MARARSSLREPLGEVEDDAGEEAGFGDAEEEACGVELPGGTDEEHGDGDDSPGDHDAGEPATGSEAIEEQVRGDLAGGVAEEEETCAEAVDGGAEVEIAVHLQRGEADVDAVHVGCAVAQGDERDEVAGRFAHGGCADGCVSADGWFVGHGGRGRGHWFPPRRRCSGLLELGEYTYLMCM